jgi:glycosyltransferase involved in cell wall biosynthesis
LFSTYPPTQCGLASFTGALRDSMLASRPGMRVGVVRMLDGPATPAGPEVVYELRTDADPARAAQAAAHLSRFDVAIVQHEYGIFGGPAGSQVLSVLSRIQVPVIAVLHTVLSEPTAEQRYVLEQVAAHADVVVTMTRTGQQRIMAGYDVDPAKLAVVSHGAWPGGRPRAQSGTGRRPMVLTWGLLGPGKGLEWGVDALPALRVLDPAPLYVVAGQIHPRVLARDGERYRDSLRRRAERLGVSDMLHFEPGYLDLDSLRSLVAQADVVLLPYDSHQQVTSGVLIEAVAALTPVVATAFPHARELLAGGAGVLVPHRDPEAIGIALHEVLSQPMRAARMRTRAAGIAPAMAWPAVADRYLCLAGDIVRGGRARSA